MVTGFGKVLDLSIAAALGFEPTSTGPRWRGKFRCMHCNVDGYVTYDLLDWHLWWGRKHGIHCKKRVEAAA